MALRLAPRGERLATSQYAPQIVALGPAGLPSDLSTQAVVILANVAELAEQDAARLRRFVHGGGNLIVFAGDNVSPEAYRPLSEAGLIPGTISPNRLAGDLPFRLREWDVEHSIFRPFDDPQHGDLRGLTFRGYAPLDVAEDARVLARFFDDTPALVERTVGKGRVIWFASSCDLEWGDWARSPLFVPLVHQMLGYLTGLNEGGPVRMMLVDHATGSDAAAPGTFARDDHWQVVNVDPRESETERCTIADLVNRFGLTVRADEAEAAVETASAGPAKLEFRRTEIWHWMIVALIGLAAFEFFLANRATA
jgi:hypothetical protein